jgi:hypothetical protein
MMRQLGSFRAGVMEAMIGAVGVVVIGRCAAFATIALRLWLFPAPRGGQAAPGATVLWGR